MNDTNITIEDLEKLANDAEADVTSKRERLARLCRAYARILAAREPELFQRAPRHHGDEPGHWDNSFPPKQLYSEHTGPRALKLRDRKTEDIATSGGYYHEWRRVTTYGGLRIGRDGLWYRSEETGSGRIGGFAAYPGDCGVDCSIEWETVSDDDLDLDELRDAETQLRALAFLAAAAKAS